MVARSPEPKAHVSNVRAFRIESEFRRRSWFLVEGKTGLPGGKPHGAEKRTNNKLDPHCNFESANRTPGHIVERRMLSPLHHACSLKIFLRSGNGSSFIFNDDDYDVDDSDDDDDDDDEVKFLSEYRFLVFFFYHHSTLRSGNG